MRCIVNGIFGFVKVWEGVGGVLCVKLFFFGGRWDFDLYLFNGSWCWGWNCDLVWVNEVGGRGKYMVLCVLFD